ncbi:MAG: PLP-dependent aminotransferase family protein [Pseudomonadota bacterium]
MDENRMLAPGIAGLQVNALREILKVVNRPGMISLAGGIPAPESFPLPIVAELTQRVLSRYGAAALQYDATEGFGPLREALTGYLAGIGIGIHTATDKILIASGSQGVLDAIGKVLIGRGDGIAVEAPTYLGALQAFNPYGPRYVCLDTDEQGVLPDFLERVLAESRIKFIYLVPTFQNPTGRTINMERRMRIAEALKRHDALLIEDDPYSELRYAGSRLPSIKTLAPRHVVYVGTFSKILAPGLRVGFCVAPEAVRRWLVIAKQGVDLHTGTFSQALAAEYLSGGHLERQLPRIRDLYRPKLQAMLRSLAKYLPAGFTWSKPEGGMFVWVEGPRGMDTSDFYEAAIEKKTAFVPGKYFYPFPNRGLETMRLNFTMATVENIDRAVKTIAESAQSVLSFENAGFGS